MIELCALNMKLGSLHFKWVPVLRLFQTLFSFFSKKSLKERSTPLSPPGY